MKHENIGGGSNDPEKRKESKERLDKPVPVNFFKLGGTWDMVINKEGQKIGSGSLDDDKLLQIQEEIGIFTRDPEARASAERKLVTYLYSRFKDIRKEELDVATHLSSWAKGKDDQEFKDFVSGPLIPLFSGDSSHLRNALVAPMVTTLIERAIKEPNKPIIGGQGTDTADIALLGPFDVLTFDTELPPLILAGANRSHRENNSDAPKNFIDLAKLAHIDLESGSYWVFQGNLYKASDFVKIDPLETRSVEEQFTFFAPHKTHESIDHIWDRRKQLKANWNLRKAPSDKHISHRINSETLYDAFEAIYVDDLGHQNSIPKSMVFSYDSSIKAIVVGAHSLGNVDNETRYDLVQAAKEGKLVVGASRTLIGDTTLDYAASLLGANINPKELGGTGKIILSAHKLSKSMARAVLARAILENLDQNKTQKLLDNYAKSRKLM